MSFKNVIACLIAAPIIIPTMSWAKGFCSDENKEWNGTRCVTVGTASAATVVSGIYSAKKYSQAKALEKQHTQRLFDGRDSVLSTDRFRIDGATRQIKDGDKVEIKYQLSEADNRSHHIGLMDERAKSAMSDYDYYKTKSLTEMKARYITVIEKDTQTGTSTSKQVYAGQEPDYEARARYALQATESLEKHYEYKAKAQDARNGGKVPTYTFDKTFEGENGIQAKANSLVDQKLNRGGKIVMIERLAAEHVSAVKRLSRMGTAGAVGVGVGLAAVAVEVTTGIAAKNIDKAMGKNHPQVNFKATR